jgi:hypothetical protein
LIGPAAKPPPLRTRLPLALPHLLAALRWIAVHPVPQGQAANFIENEEVQVWTIERSSRASAIWCTD